jgi:hypothetical protein
VAGSRIIDSGALTVSANGKLDCTNIAWVNVGGNWDSSAGKFVSPSGQVNMTGNYKSIKLGSVQGFYDLKLINGYFINVTATSKVNHTLFYSGCYLNESYDFKYGTTLISSDHQSSMSGLVVIGAYTFGVQNLYKIVVNYLALVITPDAGLNGYLGVVYEYYPQCNKQVTWIVTLSDSQLNAKSNGSIVGMIDNYSDIVVSVMVTDLNGIHGYKNWTVVVLAAPVIDLGIVYYMIFLISMLVLNLVGYFKGIGILQIITMLAVIGTAVAAFSAFSGYEMIAVMFVLIVVVMTAIGIMKRG